MQVKGNFLFDTASHRDFLGACLGTGIDRRTVGDILVQGDQGAQILCTPEMASFLEMSLTQVCLTTTDSTASAAVHTIFCDAQTQLLAIFSPYRSRFTQVVKALASAAHVSDGSLPPRASSHRLQRCEEMQFALLNSYRKTNLLVS